MTFFAPVIDQPYTAPTPTTIVQSHSGTGYAGFPVTLNLDRSIKKEATEIVVESIKIDTKIVDAITKQHYVQQTFNTSLIGLTTFLIIAISAFAKSNFWLLLISLPFIFGFIGMLITVKASSYFFKD